MSLTSEEIHKQLSAVLDLRSIDFEATVLGAGSDDIEAGRSYLGRLAEGGWMVPSWPSEYGGRNADSKEVAQIAEALDDYEAVDLYPYGVGLSLVGPVLLECGTSEQRTRWLRSIADGSEIWCQMFSEPNAGSDLANAGMRAEKDGDMWILNGSKVWTSRGAYAKWGMCLARTDTSLPKHKGLTMFAVDMSGSGVDIRTLEQMNGDRHFSEVFISEVEVPDTNRIGEFGAGWSIALKTLAFERASLGGRSFGSGGDSNDGQLPLWLEDLKKANLLVDPVSRQEAMKAFILHWVNEVTTARIRSMSGNEPGPAGSGTKLRNVSAFKARAYLSKNLSGASGLLVDSFGHLEFITAPSMSIRGGTDEVQRNILGERVLGLPGEPRVDKEVAYRDLTRGL